MLMALALATAAAASAGKPPPIGDDKWITADDHAGADVRSSRQGRTRLQPAIDARGLPLTCQVIGSSGFAGLDGQACTLLLQRARFAGPRPPVHRRAR